MLEKITGFEFKMYFIPGFYGILVVSLILYGFGELNVPLEKVGDITESVLFLFGTYFLGHVIQTMAIGFKIRGKQITPMKVIERLYWRSKQPSYLLLIKNHSKVSNYAKNAMIEAAKGKKILKDKEAKALLEQEDQFNLSHRVFYSRLKHFTENVESGLKRSEALSLMFRGFYTISFFAFLGATVVLLLKVVALKWAFFGVSVSWTNWAWWAALSAVTTALFGHRYRGVAEGFVKEVLYSYLNETQ